MIERVILITGFSGHALSRLKAAFARVPDIQVVSTLEQLRQLQPGPNALVLSFGTGVIIPHELLLTMGRPAYNLHAASPEFPGRDPHHHAIYRGAENYGATLHVMAEKVDAGPIVAIESFPVASDATPASLLAAANEAGMRLIERVAARLLDAAAMPELPDVVWGKVKTTRADLVRLSRITPLMDGDEFERRFRAFDGEGYDNLVVELHQRTFRIDKRSPTRAISSSTDDDFTEQAFLRLLRSLKTGGYRFSSYGDMTGDQHVIWRHDVDFSMHRAMALAEIEAREGVAGIYFVNPRSAFYNLLEPSVIQLVHRIADLGHEVGLHFDAAAYGTRNWDAAHLEACVDRERNLLQLALNFPIRSLSWHNPDTSNLLDFDSEDIAGLKSAYSRRLRNEYKYCSDSNGYWRFQPMSDVIAEGHQRLHLLTHPDWWTKERLSPSARVDRAILGRARSVRREYEAGLERAGRRNVIE